ncbi:MAG: DUF4290 domain-containing protein [Paludibacteraceae bacterium]|nr:DUF4290 domain-containing protein [Paludibacteraceae bacterium]
MQYSQQEERLIMPEYGRNVQRMVEYACTISDREEREQCVRTIMQTMMNLFPYLRSEESQHKLYDHLAIMSDFKLDIDYPYGKPTPVIAEGYQHQMLEVPDKPVRYRHYGRLIEQMVKAILEEPDMSVREQMTLTLGNRMKQNFLTWNSDEVSDERIKEDISRLSNGLLRTDFEGFQLLPTEQLVHNQNRKKKKK